MSYPFNSGRGLVLIRADIEGPTGSVRVNLALDTGATDTMVAEAALVTAGYDPTLVAIKLPVTTASGVVLVPQIVISRFSCLGQTRIGFPVMCHTLPAGARVDGVIGLDFLRGCALTVDFRLGIINLA